MFISLPNPDSTFLRELNEIFFNFIWSNKPDKIRRKILTLDNRKGGIKMIHLEKFIDALKVTWLRRALRNDSPWITIFQSDIIKDFIKFQNTGSTFAIKQINSTQNNFWISVLQAWDTLFSKHKPTTIEHILSTPLWYN